MSDPAEGPDRRAALIRDLMRRTGLDVPLIEDFLRAFYAAARVDPLLGPAFASVPDWEAHIARLTRFWASVALMTGAYHGRPLEAHADLRLRPEHFVRWLALFERVARERLPPAGTEHLLERARRIAHRLETALVPPSPPTRTAMEACP